jgi:hypothetical protein
MLISSNTMGMDKKFLPVNVMFILWLIKVASNSALGPRCGNYNGFTHNNER